MGARHRGREIALQILYKVDITNYSLEDALEIFKVNFESKSESWSFARDLATGMHQHLNEIDSLIEKQSERWKISRMPVTDRNILRLAVYELLYREDIPSRVTLNEAIELGKRFGTEESGAFINGVLDNIYKSHPAAKDDNTKDADL